HTHTHTRPPRLDSRCEALLRPRIPGEAAPGEFRPGEPSAEGAHLREAGRRACLSAAARRRDRPNLGGRAALAAPSGRPGGGGAASERRGRPVLGGSEEGPRGARTIARGGRCPVPEEAGARPEVG